MEPAPRTPASEPSHITLVAHTHWDREWYEPFEVFRAHLCEMLDEALDDLERDPRLAFTLDGHVALVDDYLELRPRAEPRIRALVEAGRLHIGPWYTQADTLLADGEALIRNLVFGLRRADELGGSMRLGYMPDQFGHAAQLPQILRRCGIDGAVLWRGVGPERPPHAFRWVSPDGSEVTAIWLQDGYSSGRRLPSDPTGFADAVERMLERLGGWLGEMPVLVPVGDDHVKLAAWLPEAAAALKARRPGIEVSIGGYQDHLPRVRAPMHTVRGELRSPAFAPVLAGVASARIREKQMAARASVLVERYAEPLAAWVAEAGGGRSLVERLDSLIARAWRNIFLNHAHDSAAGCGVDVSHEDVRARFRWAEQLARSACDQALARLRIAPPSGGSPAMAFHPGPAAPVAVFEAELPRSLDAGAVAIGPDGIARPIQPLAEVEQRPLFEGEFSAGELGQYLGGLDPATPLFGKYLTGIVARAMGDGLMQLDVGLGETPAAPGALAEDQRKLVSALESIARFRVVLHGGLPTRPVLVAAGPAPTAGFIAAAVRDGEVTPGLELARRVDGERPAIAVGPLTVTAEPDGTVLITDARAPFAAPVRANDLVDEGDRGDLYHHDAAGAPVRARTARAEVIESGPLRARLRIVQELDLPVGLTLDRRSRTEATLPTLVATEVTLTIGERRVEFATTLDNRTCDHRLRALVHLPLAATRVDVEHGLAVISRPLDPKRALGAGQERAAPTGQHHGFVDVSDGEAGVALFSRGLPEHEVLPEEGGGARLALTLLRSVGWLSRGDLSVIDTAAGPMMPTPDAQELGAHRFEYALVLHGGDWRRGGVLDDARRYAAPPLPVRPKGKLEVPAGRGLVEVAPTSVVVTASYPAPDGSGVVVRLLNATPDGAVAELRPGMEMAEAVMVDPLERPIPGRAPLTLDGGAVRVPLGAWEIATVLVRRGRA